MVVEQAFRDLRAAVCAPVTVVAAAEEGPTGKTVSAFRRGFSFTPSVVRMVLFGHENHSSHLLRGGTFCGSGRRLALMRYTFSVVRKGTRPN